MNPRYQMTKVQHVRSHVLRIGFEDGAVFEYDFGPWFMSERRTPYERRYRAVDWFKRYKMHPAYLEWGDMLIGMYAKDIREGHITGIETKKRKAA